MTSKVRPERRGYEKMIFEQHKQRLKGMEPTINSGPPHDKPKTDKWEQDKRREYLAIEYDNKLMLARLAKAVQTKGIDNEMHKSVEFHQQFKKKLALATKREKMAKLTRENKKLLRSIQEVSPAYNHIEWEEDAKRHDLIKRTMCLYPEYYERLDEEKEQKARTRSLNRSQMGLSASFDGSSSSGLNQLSEGSHGSNFLPPIGGPGGGSSKKKSKSAGSHGH